MKNIIKIIFVLLSILFIYLNFEVGKKQDETSKNKFKNEYESLNEKYVFVTIKEENTVFYANLDDIKEALDKTSIIFFGNSKNNESRILAEALTNLTKKKIYYYEIKKEDEVRVLVEEKLKDEIRIPMVLFVTDGKIENVIKEEIKNKEETIKIVKEKLKK